MSAGAGQGPVWICLLKKEWDTSRWLCALHIRARRAQTNAAGLLIWGSVTKLGTVAGDCGDCVVAREAAPDYVTPTPVYSPTRSESRLLTRAELARIAMPTLLHPPTGAAA